MIKHIPTDIDQYEARKEQEKYSRAEQIKREIEAHRSEIKNLENKITKYDQMQSDTNEVIGKLKSAKLNLANAKNNLNKNYSTNPSDKYLKKIELFKDKSEKIDETIRKLSNIILEEIEDNIKAIETEITNRKAIIQRLQNELNNL